MTIFALWYHATLTSLVRFCVIYTQARWAVILVSSSCTLLYDAGSIGITCAATLTYSVASVLFANRTRYRRSVQLAYCSRCRSLSRVLSPSVWTLWLIYLSLRVTMQFLASLIGSVNLLSLFRSNRISTLNKSQHFCLSNGYANMACPKQLCLIAIHDSHRNSGSRLQNCCSVKQQWALHTTPKAMVKPKGSIVPLSRCWDVFALSRPSG